MITLQYPEYLHIPCRDNTICFGADQEWFPQSWQRRAGCGPTTASHLVLYNQGKDRLARAVDDQEQMIALMQQLWEYVTPTLMGVHLVSQFTRGLGNAMKELQIEGDVVSLPITRAKERRPAFSEILDFIEESLLLDQPVAFLNLHHGEVKNLDSWHWVTIVGVDSGSGAIEVYDGGKPWVIDLALWYETTPRAGGFAAIRH